MVTFFVFLTMFLFLGNLVSWPMLVVASKEIERLKGGGRDSLPSSPKPVCLCKHGINYHVNRGGCQAKVAYTADGAKFTEAHKCPCQAYTGPEPLPEYVHPLEIGTEE